MKFRLLGPGTLALLILAFALISVGVDVVSSRAGEAVGHGKNGWAWLGSMFSGAWAIIQASADLTIEHPKVIAAIFVFVLVVVALRLAANAAAANAPKDPQRLFTKEQRMAARERAGGQCEFEGPFFRRCTRTGEHGDHYFPHTKGGATNQANHVWACAKCNLSKGAKVPTLWHKIRLERRRRKYFPDSMPVVAGAKYNDIPGR